VGLALTFVGVAYLVWALVAGVSRAVVQEMIKTTTGTELPESAHIVKVFFVDAGFVIDLVGLGWLTASLLLVVFSSRQRLSISWAWVSAACQSFIAALGAVVVGWAAYQPHIKPLGAIGMGQTPWETVSSISLPVLMPIAILIWVTFLVWLLVERARLSRRGPTLRDGLRTNVYR
jgi:hypothetical protein